MRLVLLFENLLNIHLVKDVGQIPYLLQRDFGLDCTIVCRRPAEPLTYLEFEVQGLKVEFITFSAEEYLRQHACEIDILMLFFVCTKSIKLGMLYKELNPKGFLYVKADVAADKLLYSTWGARNFFTQARRNYLFSRFLNKLDLLSLECKASHLGTTNVPEQKKLHLPNGFDAALPARYGININSYDRKDNLILLVGRHGSEQKNSELLLSVAEEIGDLGIWSMVFAGPCTESFASRYHSLSDRNPLLARQIILAGEITDRRQLLELYNQTKIFCLPSRWESWGLVATEAICFGCVPIISREILSSGDLTDNGAAGFLAGCGQTDEWVTLLTRLMAEPELAREYSTRAFRYFHENLDWRPNLARLTERLEQGLHHDDN